MDNFTPGFMAKLISAIWVRKLGFERKLQLVAVKVGFLGSGARYLLVGSATDPSSFDLWRRTSAKSLRLHCFPLPSLTGKKSISLVTRSRSKTWTTCISVY
jgi:hypothetical protein